MSELKYPGFKENCDPFSETQLKNLPLTMSYVPFQAFDENYREYDALKRGTLFPSLDKPFCGKFTGDSK